MDSSRSGTDYYFESYGHFGIHEEMLKDEVRTLSYRNAIYRNRDAFAGKVVLDVGCGTGILSMFAATAGAKLVIGVDMSDMIEHARVIVKANNFDDKIVLIKGKMEEVILPVEKVDIIISEWMGYFLLYESMLETVLWARDKYLVPGGLLFPDKATMNIAAIEDAEYKDSKIHYWDNVYGFDMSCIKPYAIREPLVDLVEAKACVTTDFVFMTIDINTVKNENLDFVSDFDLKITKQDYIHGLVAWFTTSFPSINSSGRTVSFSTGPYDKQTHWKQTVFYLPEDLSVSPGQHLKGSISCYRNKKNHRNLDISLKCILFDQNGTQISSELSYNYCIA